MESPPARDLSEYPRPWFYRPEIYYGLFIFPPVWSVLTLRSPWHSGEGFRGIMVGGIAWFIMIAAVVLSVRWVQEGGVRNLFIFVPGILLTLLTQVQWQAHRAHFGPPPTEEPAERPATARATAEPADDSGPDDGLDSELDDGNDVESRQPDGEASEEGAPAGFTPRRRRRRRRRPISRSADSAPLC